MACAGARYNSRVAYAATRRAEKQQVLEVEHHAHPCWGAYGCSAKAARPRIEGTGSFRSSRPCDARLHKGSREGDHAGKACYQRPAQVGSAKGSRQVARRQHTARTLSWPGVDIGTSAKVCLVARVCQRPSLRKRPNFSQVDRSCGRGKGRLGQKTTLQHTDVVTRLHLGSTVSTHAPAGRSRKDVPLRRGAGAPRKCGLERLRARVPPSQESDPRSVERRSRPGNDPPQHPPRNSRSLGGRPKLRREDDHACSGTSEYSDDAAIPAVEHGVYTYEQGDGKGNEIALVRRSPLDKHVVWGEVDSRGFLDCSPGTVPDGAIWCEMTDSEPQVTQKGPTRFQRILRQGRDWGTADMRLPIHAKCVGRLRIDSITHLIHEFHPRHEHQWTALRRFIEDVNLYERALQQTKKHHRVSPAALSQQDVERMLQARIIAKLHEPPLGTVRMFSVNELAKHRRRPITWTRDLNELFGNGPSISLPQARHLVQSVTLYSWGLVADLKGWFFQIPLSDKVSRCHAFKGPDGQHYRCMTLPMGQRCSPGVAHFIASLMAAEVMRRTTEHGVPQGAVVVNVYIDNFRFLSNTPRYLGLAAKELLAVCALVGATLNEKAAQLLPRQQYVFLGIDFDHVHRRVRCDRMKIERFRESLQPIDQWTVHQMLMVFGKLFHFATLRDLGSTMNEHFFALKFFRRRVSALCKGRLSFESSANVWPSVRHLIADWIRHALMNDWFYPPTQEGSQARSPTFVFSDASNHGYGYVIWRPGEMPFWGGGTWTTEKRGTHINILEAEAACIALRSFTQRTKEKQNVMLLLDNTSAQHTFSKGYSPSWGMNEAARRARQVIQDSTVFASLEIGRVAGGENNPADAPSRGLVEHLLCTEVLRRCHAAAVVVAATPVSPAGL